MTVSAVTAIGITILVLVIVITAFIVAVSVASDFGREQSSLSATATARASSAAERTVAAVDTSNALLNNIQIVLQQNLEKEIGYVRQYVANTFMLVPDEWVNILVADATADVLTVGSLSVVDDNRAVVSSTLAFFNVSASVQLTATTPAYGAGSVTLEIGLLEEGEVQLAEGTVFSAVATQTVNVNDVVNLLLNNVLVKLLPAHKYTLYVRQVDTTPDVSIDIVNTTVLFSAVTGTGT